MDLRVRKVLVKDSAAILIDLYKNIFIESYHTKIDDEDSLRKSYDHCSAYIAYDDEKPIGFLIIEDKARFNQLWEFGLLPEYQHKGAGKQLLQVFLSDSNKEIRLITNPRNSPAVIFYLRNGFEIYEWKEKLFNNQDWMVLRKNR